MVTKTSEKTLGAETKPTHHTKNPTLHNHKNKKQKKTKKCYLRLTGMLIVSPYPHSPRPVFRNEDG